MKVAVDIDDVSADLAPYLLNRVNQKYGMKYKPEDIKSWDFKMKHPKGEVDYTTELFDHFSQPGFLYGMPVVPGAQEGIEELRRRGHKPFFLTGRREKEHGPETQRWIREYYPGMKVYYAPEGKHKYINNADLFLEDNPKEVKNVGLHGGNVTVYDRPWNRDLSPLYGPRVHSWEEFLNSMKQL